MTSTQTWLLVIVPNLSLIAIAFALAALLFWITRDDEDRK